jgi:hypothetical protein
MALAKSASTKRPVNWDEVALILYLTLVKSVLVKSAGVFEYTMLPLAFLVKPKVW